jgi:hypothetical protein
MARWTIAALVAAAAGAPACSKQATSVPVRSLEQSGQAAFVCLSSEAKGAPLDVCDVNAPTYGYYHLFSLITQTSRGEVAVVDLTSGAVLDLDKAVPGYNFVPVGAEPVDIVATPGGTAAYVGSAEPNKYAIYALPTADLFKGKLHLAQFGACALPSAPGRMLMITQPLQEGVQRTCDGGVLSTGDHPHGDLSVETSPPGTRKLLVALPDQGDLAVIDAQQLLDSPGGTLQACAIERLIHLKVDLPATLPVQVTPEGGYPPGQDEKGGLCVDTQGQTATSQSGYRAHPVHLSQDPENGLVYVADDMAPVVHVIDVADPCSPVERPPLLPMSVLDPWRVVYTREVAVSSTTTSGKKFAYAIDQREGSMMIFDVSTGSTNRTPLLRPYPDRNPFQARDRIAFTVPIKSLVFLMRDPTPLGDPVTGAAVAGITCDPDANSTAIGTGYRTSADFTTGANPRKLRGIYGAAMLTNGQIVFIDVDDFDAACRRPKTKGWCSNETFSNYEGANGEASCSVIEPNQPRNSAFLATSDVPGSRFPGLQAYPSLSQNSKTLTNEEGQPRLLAPRMTDSPGVIKIVQVGSRPVDTIESNPVTAVYNMVWFDQREPRAHYDQEWTVVWEGQIPGTTGHVARFNPSADGTSAGTVEDASGYFCDRGVHDFDAAVRYANTLGYTGTSAEPGTAAYAWAEVHTDSVQIGGGLLLPEDPYWASVSGTCSYQKCFDLYGASDVTPLSATRDLPILEAYQDHVVVSDPLKMANCCFPMLTGYAVRAQQQWVVSGSVSGFLHKVNTDRDTGRCVDSCDPSLRLRNGRALYWMQHFDETSVNVESQLPAVDDPRLFRNPTMQFWIHPASAVAQPDPANPGAQRQPFTDRDKYFSFITTGGFYPLVINLGASTTYVQPQSITWLPHIGSLAIADGSVQGLMLVDVGLLMLTVSYY